MSSAQILPDSTDSYSVRAWKEFTHKTSDLMHKDWMPQMQKILNLNLLI